MTGPVSPALSIRTRALDRNTQRLHRRQNIAIVRQTRPRRRMTDGDSGGTYQTIGRVRIPRSGSASFQSIAIWYTGDRHGVDDVLRMSVKRLFNDRRIVRIEKHIAPSTFIQICLVPVLAASSIPSAS